MAYLFADDKSKLPIKNMSVQETDVPPLPAGSTYDFSMVVYNSDIHHVLGITELGVIGSAGELAVLAYTIVSGENEQGTYHAINITAKNIADRSNAGVVAHCKFVYV